MQQRHNSINAVIKKHNITVLSLSLAVIVEAQEECLLLLLQCKRSLRVEVEKMIMRSKGIPSTTFNLNAYSESACLHKFRFRPDDIGTLATFICFNGVSTSLNIYYCDSETAWCIFLRRLWYPRTLYDMEEEFGMHSSKISEIFWENLEHFIVEKGGFLMCRNELMQRHAAVYADALSRKSSLLDTLVGLIDCTKIKMTRPGGMEACREASTHAIRGCTASYTRQYQHARVWSFACLDPLWDVVTT